MLFSSYHEISKQFLKKIGWITLLSVLGIESQIQGNDPAVGLSIRGHSRNAAQVSSAQCRLLASSKMRHIR